MSLNINGINASAYTDYMQQQTSNAVGDKLKATLESAAEKAGKTGDGEEIDRELMDACNQFEAYFLEKIFKEMQKSVDALKTEETSSAGQMVDFFKDQTLQDVALKSTETQGLGFAQMLYENMKHTAGMSPADIIAQTEKIAEEEAKKQAGIVQEPEENGGLSEQDA